MRRLRWLHLPAALLVVAGCSSTHKAVVAPTTTSTSISSTTSTTVVATSSSTIGDTTTTPAAAYPTVSATGSLLQPPTTSLAIPAEQDCHQLLTQPAAIASIKACATATSQSGTVTGTDEGYAHTQQWDVWKRNGNDAHLVLTYTGNFQSTPGFVFHSADPANGTDPKLLAVEHAAGAEPVRALDIIEASGVVVAHITVGDHGGVVGPAPNGGIETWTATTSNSANANIIRYTNGAWRIVSASSVPASQVPNYPNDDGFGGGLP